MKKFKFNAFQKIFDKNKKTFDKNLSATEKTETETIIYNANQLEQDRFRLLHNNMNKYKVTTFGLGVIVLIQAIGLVVLAKEEKIKTYVVQTDRFGSSRVLEPKKMNINSMGTKQDRHNITLFVDAMNTYNYNMQQHFYDTVKYMSDDKIFSRYKKAFLDSDDSPLKKYGANLFVNADITNISFLPTDNSNDQTALVNVTTTVKDSNGSDDLSYQKQQKTIVLSYNYNKKITNTKELSLNPNGFQVTSYSISDVTNN